MPKVTQYQLTAATLRHCHRIRGLLAMLETQLQTAGNTADSANWADLGSLQRLERELVDAVLFNDWPSDSDRDFNEDEGREYFLEKVDPEGEAYFSPITLQVQA